MSGPQSRNAKRGQADAGDKRPPRPSPPPTGGPGKDRFGASLRHHERGPYANHRREYSLSAGSRRRHPRWGLSCGWVLSVFIGGSNQNVRGRLSEGDIQLELSPVVVENGIEVSDARPRQEAQTVEHLQGDPDLSHDAAQVFLIRLGARLDRQLARPHLGETGVRFGVGVGHFGPDLIERGSLLKIRAAQPAVGRVDRAPGSRSLNSKRSNRPSRRDPVADCTSPNRGSPSASVPDPTGCATRLLPPPKSPAL